MNNLLVILITLVSIALIILIIYTVIFLVGLIKTMKQVRLASNEVMIASKKVQESADTATELVDEVRSAVVNPGVIAMLIEKYLRKHYEQKGKRNRWQISKPVINY